MTNSQSITMASGKKIILEDGGELELASGSVIFYGSNWGGIEINDNAVWDVHSCTILGTTTPIIIQGGDEEYDNLYLSNISCLNTGPIQITNRSNVTVIDCHLNYNCATTT